MGKERHYGSWFNILDRVKFRGKTYHRHHSFSKFKSVARKGVTSLRNAGQPTIMKSFTAVETDWGKVKKIHVLYYRFR